MSSRAILWKSIIKNFCYGVILSGAFNLLFNPKFDYKKALLPLTKINSETFKTIVPNENQSANKKLSTFFQNGEALFNKGKHLESLAYFKKTIEIIEEEHINDNVLKAKCHFLIGRIYQEVEKYDEAIDKYKQALKILHSDINLNAEIYHYCGEAYMRQYDFYEARTYLMKALQLKKSLLGNKDVSTSLTYYSLSELYSMAGNNSTACEYIEAAAKIIKENKNEKRVRTELRFLYITAMLKLLQKPEFFVFRKTKEWTPLINELDQDPKSGAKTSALGLYLKTFGEYLISKGQREFGFRLLKQSLEIMRIYFGKTHPKVQSLYKEIYEYYIFYWRDPEEIRVIMMMDQTYNPKLSLN